MREKITRKAQTAAAGRLQGPAARQALMQKIAFRAIISASSRFDPDGNR